MLKFRSSKWLIGLLAFLNINCNNALYNPVNENIDPAISPGEINASFNANISDYYMPQAAISYSPVQNFNITYNTFQGFAQKSHSFSIGHYINKIDTASLENSASFLINVGYGFGENVFESEYYNQYDFIAGKYICKYSKLFLQLGYIANTKYLDFTFNTRAVYVDWYNLTFINNAQPFSYGYNPLPLIARYDPYHFQEFSFKIAATRNAFKVFTLLNFRLPLFDNNNSVEFNAVNIGVGCSVKLNELFKKN